MERRWVVCTHILAVSNKRLGAGPGRRWCTLRCWARCMQLARFGVICTSLERGGRAAEVTGRRSNADMRGRTRRTAKHWYERFPLADYLFLGVYP